MKGIILASHGRLAEGMLDTLKIFAGECEQIQALCLMAGDDVSEYLEKLKKTINEVDQGDGVVVFCDLLFGSPCNCSARFLNDPLYMDRVTVFTGMNLPLVLEYINSREIGISNEELLTTGKGGVVNFNDMLAANKQ